MPELYIGLMSGTSLDGIDAGLVDFSSSPPSIVHFEFTPFSQQLKDAIKALSYSDHTIHLKDYGSLDSELGHLFATACISLLSKAGIPANQIKAIGSHGQTIYHAPETKHPFSLQIGDPNIIAQLTKITTVADFRRRDMAAKGQGAPLVPAFHHAVFHHSNENRCIVNIGGIANITLLPRDDKLAVTGFDTGPGNTLMDLWIKLHLDKDYDANGEWARSGIIQKELLEHLNQDTYFSLSAPKSTGKEYFSLNWLENNIPNLYSYQPEDIQATLCQLTVTSIADAIKKQLPRTQRTLICGGGIHNAYLLELLAKELDQAIYSTNEYSIDADHVEAVAFAWLARQTINHLPGNLCDVTGAKAPVILGGIYL